MKEIAPPFAVLAELTHRCPLQCPYCSNPLMLERVAGELNTAAWQDVLDQAAAMGVLQVHFSGGEPTIRKDLKALVTHASTRGLYTNLITSGVLLDRSRLAALADAGLDHLQLSVQDAEGENADRIGRYRGGHDKKLAVGRWTRELGIPLTLNAVVHRQNLSHLQNIIDLAVSLDAARLEVAHVQYYGWALKNRAALIPTREQLDAATAVVEAARMRLTGIMTIDYVVPDYYAQKPKACMGGWGQRFFNVSPSGKVLPCHAAEGIAGMTFERVTDRPLADIWRSSPAFERFRGTAWMPEPCRSCEHREIDWGGCRCQAFALEGDPSAVDPACGFAPTHHALIATAVRESAEPAPDFLYRRFGNI